MSEQNPFMIPCYPLFEKIQLAMIPIQRQLLVTQSMLRWAKSILDKNCETTYAGWMLTTSGMQSKEKQLETLLELSLSVHNLGLAIKEIMAELHIFSSFKRVRAALLSLHEAFKQLPLIEPDLQLISLRGDLLDHKESLPNLLAYTDKLFDVQQKAFFLKEIVLKEFLDHLSVQYTSKEQSISEFNQS